MTVESNRETLGFQAEVKQLLHLMIHSLYSNREIFLRELISNASDACDKLRFEALHKEGLFEDDPDLRIRVEFDPEAKTVTVSDNGIGMSREEVLSNLGTIAKSGTSDFLKTLTGDQQKDSQLIGQFGVGFYSAFIVAERVEVLTRRAGLAAAEGVRWVSAGDGEYTVETVERAQRGTEIVLHLKESETEFAEEYRLRSIIQKYSDHIGFPIEMLKPEPPKTDDEDGEEKEDAKAESAEDDAAPEFETVNSATALWTRPRQEIEDDEYKAFYKHIAHDFEDPLTWGHNRVEGKLEYTSLLYVPKRAPFDLWNRDQPRGLKLYVQRVFIMDQADQFLPLYLRFIKGVVDSNDLSLNVSRELLQDDATVRKMRSALTKRALDMLAKMATDNPGEYRDFWKEFGNVLKEGPAEDFANREDVARLFRFATTHTDKPEQEHSLEDYVARMKEGQEKIYYIAADSFSNAKNSPHLEVFRRKGIEVVLMYDRIDEWMISSLPEFDGKKFQDITKGELDLGELESEEERKAREAVAEEHKDLVERVRKALGEQVDDVRVTDRLTDSPACVVLHEHEMGAQMRRIMEAAGQKVPAAKPVFELNPEHPLVTRLEGESDDKRFGDLAMVLFEQATLAEGGQLEDAAGYVQRLNRLLLDLTA